MSAHVIALATARTRNTLQSMRTFPWVLLVFLFPLAAFADGKVIPSVAVREAVAIPDQQAMITWTGGVERLVIQTAFHGTGTNFAWVVPLPAKPEIEAASEGLFPTLNYLFQPELVHDVLPVCGAVLFASGLLYCVLTIRGGRSITWKTIAAMAAVYVSLFMASPAVGLFGSALFTCGVVLVLSGRQPVYIILLLILIGMLLGAMLLPSLARSKAMPSATEATAVEVLERKTIGSFETVVLSSSNANALSSWLTENQFDVPSNAVPVIADYVRRGWVFVAAKLSRPTPELETSKVHPLSFTFPAAEPVYPMRLTGVDGTPMSLDLYVFGPGLANAKGLKLRRSSKVSLPARPNTWARRKPPALEMHHPLLRKWIGDGLVGTHLSGKLLPSQMQEDFTLKWKPFRQYAPPEYSYKAAITHAANWGLPIFLVGGLIWALSSSIRLRRVGLGLALCGVAVAMIVYGGLQKIRVQMVRGYFWASQTSLAGLGWAIEDANSLQQAREDIGRELEHLKRYSTNFLIGGRIKEQDSPGNYTISEADNELILVGYDAVGAPHVMHKTPKASPPDSVVPQ